LTSKLITKLLGLFLLLMVLEIAAVELVVRPLTVHTAAGAFHRLALEALWSGLIALAIAIPAAASVAGRVSARLGRVAAFAQRIAEGDLTARLAEAGHDEPPAMEAALNQAAERFAQSLAELESRRQELAVMLDSMQEAVVAITPEGLVGWSNAAMRRIAGNQIRAGRPLAHSLRDPEILACARAALERPSSPAEPLRSTPPRCPAEARSSCSMTLPPSKLRRNPAANS
jgi:HAMP domain-containing protein